MTRNKQNYMNNPNLPAVGAEFEYTSAQIKHLQKELFELRKAINSNIKSVKIESFIKID